MTSFLALFNHDTIDDLTQQATNFVLNQLNINTATPIQSQAIPAILNGQDVVACAQTGSGKTLAYGLPLSLLVVHNVLQSNAKNRPVSTLIIVPTRELAMQVGATLRQISDAFFNFYRQQHTDKKTTQPIKLAVLFGGVSVNTQMLHLRGGADIVIATPGRLLDLHSRHALTLDSVKHVVLDEADRLLELGFNDEIKAVFELLPKARQTCLFSATYPPLLSEITQKILHNPTRINIAESTQNTPDIAQRAIVVDAAKRTPLLRHLITLHDFKNVMVFAASRYASELIALKCRNHRIAAEPFHGELSQGKRNQVLADFKAGRVRVIVCTDLAARGIDINDLEVVINYDLPRSADDYIHRIGRTGRAGKSGLAISFISDNEAHFRLIEKRQNKQVTREIIVGFEPTQTAPLINAEDTLNGGVKGTKPNKKDKLRALGLKKMPPSN